MLTRTTLLLVICLLILPACKYNFAGQDASDPNAPVEFSYGPGTRYVHGAGTMALMQGDKQIGEEMALLSNDLRYVVKAKGDRLVWNVTAINWEEFGQPKATGPYFDITFTSDAKGHNRADLEIHAVRNDYARRCIASTMEELGLADGPIKPGEKAFPFPVKALNNDDIQVRLNIPDPRFVYDGIKEVDGEECYAFSFSADSVTIKQQGKETKGSMAVSLLTSKNMLPVREKLVMFMEGPMKNLTSKMTVLSTRAEPPAENKTEALLAKLEAAPIMPVTDPIEFKYSPSRGLYKSDLKLKAGKDFARIKYLPLMNYELGVRIEAAGDRLNWNMSMADIKVMGFSLGQVTAGYSYTSDDHGGSMADFKATSGPGLLTEADIQKDFCLPDGAYRTGDVVMPVDLGTQSRNNDFFLPDGSGYVFKGIQNVDSMQVAVFEADIPGFTARDKKTGKDSKGTLKIVRRYDLATMLPLWFEGHIEIMADGKDPVVTDFDFHRIVDRM